MTASRESRQFHSDLEVRGDGRTVAGIAAPFDQVTRIGGGHDEVIVRGAFARTIAERGDRVKFLALHNYEAMPLGRAVTLREDAAGLYGEFRVSKTTAGDEVLELIRDGALDGLSIGFTTITERWNAKSSVRELHEVRLHEVSAVTFPAYDGARILAVRSDNPPSSAPLALHRRLARLL